MVNNKNVKNLIIHSYINIFDIKLFLILIIINILSAIYKFLLF